MHLMESFIEKDSIGFELVKYVQDDIKSHEKEMELKNFKFTSKTLKYVFGDKMESDEFKQYVVSTLKELITSGLIKPQNKSMYITEKMITNFYNIN